MRMGQPHEKEIAAILEQYNRDTKAQLEKELQKAIKKFKETEALVKI